MRVLVACELSGVVRDAFRDAGHDAWSCDLKGPDDLPDVFRNQKWPNYHLEGDVRWFLNDGWDLLIAHPPCKYLCNSGVRWLHEREGRWDLMRAGAAFFCELLNATKIPRRCVENSIMHRYGVEIVGRRQDQVVQPWQHGHGETKGTCLWLEGLPLLKPTRIVKGRKPVVHRMPPGPDRERLRSNTYPGIARAMAKQWGSL